MSNNITSKWYHSNCSVLKMHLTGKLKIKLKVKNANENTRKKKDTYMNWVTKAHFKEPINYDYYWPCFLPSFWCGLLLSSLSVLLVLQALTSMTNTRIGQNEVQVKEIFNLFDSQFPLSYSWIIITGFKKQMNIILTWIYFDQQDMHISILLRPQVKTHDLHWMTTTLGSG